MVKYKEKPGEKNPENREGKGWQFSFVSHRNVLKKSYKYQEEIKRAFSPAKPGMVLPTPLVYKRLF